MVTNPSWQLPFYGQPKGASFAQIAWDLCSRFPTQLQRDCVLGGVDNLANFDQLDVKRSDAFCALTGRVQKTCYREIGVNLIRRTTDVAVARARCKELSSHSQDCIAGITQGQLPAAPIEVPNAKPEQPPAEATAKASATVRMTDQGYSPQVLKIEQGQTVEFVNDSNAGLLARVRPASDPHRLSRLRRAEEHPSGPVLEVHLQPSRPLRVPQPPEPGDPRRSGYFEGLVAEAEPLRHSESSPAGENFTQAACCSAAVE